MADEQYCDGNGLCMKNRMGGGLAWIPVSTPLTNTIHVEERELVYIVEKYNEKLNATQEQANYLRQFVKDLIITQRRIDEEAND